MPFLPIILVAEIIFASFALNFNSPQKGNILGVQLAQSDTGESSQSEPPPPAESSQNNNPPPPAEPPAENNPLPATANDNQSNPTSVPSSESGNDQSNQPASSNNQSGQYSLQNVGSPVENTSQLESSTNTQSPYSSPSPDNPSLFSDIVNPLSEPTGSEVSTPTTGTQNTSGNQLPTPETTTQPTGAETTTQTGPSENISLTTSLEPSTTPPETYLNQTASVLNPGDLLNSPEAINQQSLDEAKKEDELIGKTGDPAEQTKLLISFAVDKVKDINNSIKNDDFASTNFASQRFDADIEKAVANLQNLPPNESKQLKKQLTNFCTQADFILRSAELSVPEEAQQDLEINRAKCINIGQ